MGRRKWLLSVLFAAVAVRLAMAAATAPPRVPDLDNHLVEHFQTAPGTRAIVFFFVSVDCPISNRYAPEIRRLYEAFSSRGVAFRLVYPNPSESAAAIRVHLQEYNLPGEPLRDPRLELAKFASVTVTPEAAIYDARGAALYAGRIDDRYVSVGLERPAASRHDLEEALTAVLAGRPPRAPGGPSVGCFIADFAR
jgi:hypothetical protein